MKVAIAVPAFVPAFDFGGPIQKILRMHPALQSRGVELTVITSTLARNGEPTLPPGPAVEAGMRVLRLPTPVARRFSPWVRFSGVGQYDVLHVMAAWNGLSYAALTLGRRHCDALLWEPVGTLAARGRHVPLKRALSPAHSLLLGGCDGVIWTSRREREESAAQQARTPAHFRANPCEPYDDTGLPDRATARAALGIAGAGRLYGYLGRIDQRKGVERLLACWPGPSAGQFVVAGPVGDAALAAAIDARAADGVLRLEALSSEARWHYLRALDALVIAPDFGENFGNVVVEAMQVGTPVLATPVVGALEWTDDPGVVALADDAALRAAFAGGVVPPAPRGMPAQCEGDTVGEAQCEIYRAALAHAAVRRRAPRDSTG